MKNPLDLGNNHAKFRWASLNSFWDKPIWILRNFTKSRHKIIAPLCEKRCVETKNKLRGFVGERYNSLPISVLINFVISLWPNKLELRLEILDVGTEFHHLSHHVDEFSVNHVTMPWQSMNHSVTQVWHHQQGAPLNCNALGKCWFLQNEMEKILEIWRKCRSTSC